MGTATPVQLLHTLPPGSSAGQSRSAAWSRPGEALIRGLISPSRAGVFQVLAVSLAHSPFHLQGDRVGIKPAWPRRVRTPWALTAGGYREGQSGVLGPRTIPDILGLHCRTGAQLHTHTHTLTHSGHVELFSKFLKSSKSTRERPAGLSVGPTELGSSPASAPVTQTRPSTHGDTQRRKRRPAPSFCPPSCSSRIRPGLPSEGGPVQRTWLLTRPPNHPKYSPSLDLHLQGLPAIWGG